MFCEIVAKFLGAMAKIVFDCQNGKLTSKGHDIAASLLSRLVLNAVLATWMGSFMWTRRIIERI